MRHFDVQILGGVVLHRGNIAEMVTGEGKTLVATLPAYLNALEGKGVHIVTVNDYLARRDCEWMSPIYQALGITAGFIQSDMDPVARRKAYDCDITYGTNSEFGFDYLRDNMKPARWGDPNFDPFYQQCQKALNLRHHRRGGQHPHRRGPHAAHHLRPGLQRPAPLRQGQRHRRPARPTCRSRSPARTSRSRRRNTPAT